MIELAVREAGYLQVALLWDEELDTVMVCVRDPATENFELAADEHNALDVFYHPFAYAAFRGHVAARRTP